MDPTPTTRPDRDEPADGFFLGRQPIHDRDLGVFAYEILFRHGAADRAVIPADGGDRASAEVLARLFLDLGIDAVAESRPAFVNLTRRLLVEDLVSVFPKDRVFLEILENVEPDRELVARVKDLADRGFHIALDDFVWRPGFEPLLEIAEVVKLDVPGREAEELAEEAERARGFGCRLLAEKVETVEQFQLACDLGFDLFQGFVLSEVELLEGRRTGGLRAALLGLLGAVADPRSDPRRIEELVAADPTLAYRVLRFVEADDLGAGRPVGSVREALRILGPARLANWIGLVLMGDLAESAPATRGDVALRARLCAEIATSIGTVDPDTCFAAGLLSRLDLMLGRPLEEALRPLPLDPGLRSALLGREGPVGRILAAAAAWERGDWDRAQALGFDAVLLAEAWRRALDWSAGLRVREREREGDRG